MERATTVWPIRAIPQGQQKLHQQISYALEIFSELMPKKVNKNDHG